MKEVNAMKAVLAMILEVSATPKPGNVDRDHDFTDTKYEHFLVSAVSSYPVFLQMVGKRRELGSWIRKLVNSSKFMRGGGNTHLGTFILISPLVMASDEKNVFQKAYEIVKKTTFEDAVDLYLAIRESGAYIPPSDTLSVYDDESVRKLREEKITMYDVLSISSKYDMISDELVSGFERVKRYSELLLSLWDLGVNEAIVRTYLRLLSDEEDTFIVNKYGKEVAKDVRRRAREVIDDFSMSKLLEFDEHLISRGVNPGSSADIICGAIYVALLRGAEI
jgi:triphosphoribosyl-dephospho-CoA synthase